MTFTWMDDLPDDEVRAITKLRQLLQREPNPLSTGTSCTATWRPCCIGPAMPSRRPWGSMTRHDSEMDTIRQAFMAKWGQVPWLETYRQMAIRQQKARNFEQALWRAERGMAIYGNNAVRQRP
jgi:hypothetical protein